MIRRAAGELAPLFETLEGDGAPLDLTSTTIAFSQRELEGTTFRPDHATANIVGAATLGQVQWNPANGSEVAVGLVQAWWTLTKSGRSWSLPPFLILYEDRTQPWT